MLEKKEDLRIRRTHKLLSDALLTLMNQKPFDKITVRDICDTAMIHRSTFYTHFTDKYALLQYCLGEFKTVFDETDLTENSINGYRQYYLSVASSIAAEIQKNKSVYQTIIKKNQEESVMQNFQNELERLILEKLEKCQDTLEFPVPTEFLSTFYAGACMSVLVKWLKGEASYTMDNLLKFLELMIYQPIAIEKKPQNI